MVLERFDEDARRRVLTVAVEEARRRGDQRVGTEHLLLALLDRPGSLGARTLGVSMESARTALDDLDRQALASVGVDVANLPPSAGARGRRRPPLTSAARAALKRALLEARGSKSRRVQARHLLLGVLACERPDPAAELLAAVGVDPAEARRRLAGPPP